MPRALVALLHGVTIILCMNVDDKCGALHGTGLLKDTFASPLYPAIYPPNQDCVRVIVYNSESYDLKVVFKDVFQIETSYEIPSQVNDVTSDCPNDYVEFRDGRYGFSPLIGRFCGMSKPSSEIISRSGFLWIHFRSDEQLEYKGFLANIEKLSHHKQPRPSIRAMDCHFDAKSLDGQVDVRSLSEHVMGVNYAIDCIWRIEVDPEYSIVFYFHDFRLLFPNQCSRNFIEVYSGDISDKPKRRFCGLTASTVFTTNNLMFVRVFLSSSSYLNQTSFVGMFSAYARHKNCSAFSMLSCGDENCVPTVLKCNNVNNCPFGRDEENCNMAEDAFISFMTSSFTPLLLIIFLVFVVVVCLVIWSVRTNSFCRDRRHSYSDSLRDISRHPVSDIIRPPNNVCQQHFMNTVHHHNNGHSDLRRHVNNNNNNTTVVNNNNNNVISNGNHHYYLASNH